MVVVKILLGLLACGVTSLALGLSALRLLRIELNRGEAVCLGYVLGSAVASTLTLALALMWVAREGVFLIAAAGALILLWRNVRWLRTLKPIVTRVPVVLGCLFLAAFAVYGTLYFRQALAPEMSPDGMAYHLSLVSQWNQAHGLAKNTRMYAALPDGMEMLFLFAFAIGRHSAAALVHFSFLLVLPLLMVLYGSRFGWPRSAALLAAILIFASPVVGVDGTSAYNDVALAVCVFAAVYLLEIWRGTRQTGVLMACAATAGFAFAIKYTGGFLILFIATALVWEMRRMPVRRAAGLLLAACAIMALPAAPYLIRNVLWFQNPIAFFGNSIFRNRWFHVSFEHDYVQGLAHLNGVTWRDLPRELTIGGSKIPDCFGPAFALMPLALIGVWWPRTRLLVIAAAFMAAGFAGNKSARFLIPSAPLVAMAAVFVLSRLPRFSVAAAAIMLFHMVISLPRVNSHLHLWSGWSLAAHVSWSDALRLVPEDSYLARSRGYVISRRLIEAHVPKDATVLTLSGLVAQSYTTRPVVAAWESAEAERMKDILMATWNSQVDWTPRWTVTFPKTRVRELDIVQTGHVGEGEMWAVNEIRLWNGPTLQRRSPDWRLDAFPDPWDAELAFDGLMATRWRSWETLRPGMWIRARFPTPVEMDRADVICSEGPNTMMALILDENGQWSIPTGFEWEKDPPVDRRREATAELKRCGYRFLEITRRDWVTQAYRGDYKGWGVHEVASTPDVLLLEID